MTFTRICSITASLALTSSASLASPVIWGSLGLDQSLITSPEGQSFSNFNGIAGLDVVIMGTSGVDAPYIHPNQQLWFRSDEGTQGSRPAETITFHFNQEVSIVSAINFFGDGGIQERILVESFSGTFNALPVGGNVVTGDGTGQVLIRSGFAGSTGFSSEGVFDLAVTLDGDDANDLAGVTFALDITVVPSPATAALLGFAGLGAMRRRR